MEKTSGPATVWVEKMVENLKNRIRRELYKEQEERLVNAHYQALRAQLLGKTALSVTRYNREWGDYQEQNVLITDQELDRVKPQDWGTVFKLKDIDVKKELERITHQILLVKRFFDFQFNDAFGDSKIISSELMTVLEKDEDLRKEIMDLVMKRLTA